MAANATPASADKELKQQADNNNNTNNNNGKPKETQLLVHDSRAANKSYRLVMLGDVGDLTIGEIKKHIARDCGLQPHDQALHANGALCSDEKVQVRSLGVTDGGELTLMHVGDMAPPEAPPTKPAEVLYYQEILEDLLRKFEATRTAHLERRIRKAMHALQREVELAAEQNSKSGGKFATKDHEAVAAEAMKSLERASRAVMKSSGDEAVTEESPLVGDDCLYIADNVFAILRDLYPSIASFAPSLASSSAVASPESSLRGRGWTKSARTALKALSAAFLRLVRVRTRVQSSLTLNDAERWAHAQTLDHAYSIVRSSVKSLGELVSVTCDDVEAEFHPSLTMDDIEEMEAVNAEAHALLQKHAHENEVYFVMLAELQDLMKDEDPVDGTVGPTTAKTAAAAVAAAEPPQQQATTEPQPDAASSSSTLSSSTSSNGSGEVALPKADTAAPPLASVAGSHRDRLVEFYTTHNPERLSSVDEILQQYKGNEEVLFRVLEHKYAHVTRGGAATGADGHGTAADGAAGSANGQQGCVVC
eukprot:PhM_4_TR12062/c0_g1_i1/m.71855